MSQRDMWKVLHLLHMYGRPGLTGAALRKAGIVCDPDTLWPLLDAGAIEEREVSGRKSPEYYLSKTAASVLRNCLVANRGVSNVDMEVDTSSVFVVMPFSETWSQTVYLEVIQPAIEDAGLECVRGDEIVRVGDLSANIWNQLLKCGCVVAEVSAPNVNVFYELGLAHALGKETLFLKQADAELPADFGGAHYYDYRLGSPAAARKSLGRALRKWKKEHYVSGVQKLVRAARS